MEKYRKLRKAIGILLIVVLATGMLAAAQILDDTDSLKPAVSDSDPRHSRFFNPDLFRLKKLEEPISTPALLILAGLVALIALKGRRK
jgi:hypothetical protein